MRMICVPLGIAFSPVLLYGTVEVQE